MVRAGRRRNHFACPRSDPAEGADRMERLGVFLDGHSRAATFSLPQTADRAEEGSQKSELRRKKFPLRLTNESIPRRTFGEPRRSADMKAPHHFLTSFHR